MLKDLFYKKQQLPFTISLFPIAMSKFLTVTLEVLLYVGLI